MQSGKIYKNQGVRKDGTFTDTTDVTSAGFAAQVNAAVNAAEAAGAVAGEGGTFTLTTNPDGSLSTTGILTNEANVGFEVPAGQSKYLTAGNDVVDLSKWNGTGSVNIGDAFSGDNDKVTVRADALAGPVAKDNLKLTSIENLEIVNSGETNPVILKGANFKGLEVVKLIGDDTTLDVSDLTQGIKVDATANADNIIGSNKADTINGGDGNDTINAGSGNDVLTGGNGADTFVVGSVQSLGIDKILDFSADDKISVDGFAPKALKKFDASTFSTVNYKSLDAALATFLAGGKYQTKAGDVVIFSYDGKTYALLANGAFDEARDALVDITGANVASLTESNFGTIGNFENYAAFKAAVDAGKVDSPTTIKSITADNVAALLTTDAPYLELIAGSGIGAIDGATVNNGATVNVTMTATTLNTSTFAEKLGSGAIISKINITGTAYDDTITSSFAGSINGGAGNDTIDASAATDAVTINGGDGDDKITGGAGADVLTGGGGADSITGGKGADVIDVSTKASATTTVIYAASGDTGTATNTPGGVSGSELGTFTFGEGIDTVKISDTASQTKIKLGGEATSGYKNVSSTAFLTSSATLANYATDSSLDAFVYKGDGNKLYLIYETTDGGASTLGNLEAVEITGVSTLTNFVVTSGGEVTFVS